MIHTLYVTEILQREVEIEAESVEEALEILEKKHSDSEIFLDYSDLIKTEFADTNKREKDVAVLEQISRHCEECPSRLNCLKGECVFFKIEKIVEDGFFIEGKENPR